MVLQVIVCRPIYVVAEKVMTQQVLLAFTEKWKKNLEDKGCGGAVLMDLSKAFETLKHDLLIAKLSAYGFEHDAWTLLCSYLTNR